MADGRVGLNLGAGPFWRRPGWKTIDHKKSWWRRADTAWRLSFTDASFDWLFSSHMLEHIPHFKIDAVLKECNRVLKPGGTIRLLCPNLEVFAQAYLAKDSEMFDRLCHEDPSVRQDLGHGGKLMNFLISPGADSFLYSRNGEPIGGYAHVYSYDFDMMKALLERHGFGQITKSDFGQSAVEEMREPLHVIGTDPVWRVEREWPDRRVGTTGFDRSPHSSLFVEATKIEDDRVHVVRYGAANIRGLDPMDMSWGAMTAGYVRFSLLKARSLPRAMMQGLAMSATRSETLLHGLRQLLSPRLRLSLRKWVGLG
jgi:hypothetical protein